MKQGDERWWSVSRSEADCLAIFCFVVSVIMGIWPEVMRPDSLTIGCFGFHQKFWAL
jgi:hypothetical protein